MTGWTKSILAVLGLALTVMVVSWPLAAQEEDRRRDESEERFERNRDERRERRQRERDEEERREEWEEREHRERHEGGRRDQRERGRRDRHEERRSHDESRPWNGRDEQSLGPLGQLEVAGHAAQLLVTAGMEDVARIVEERIERLERRIEHELSLIHI